MIPLDLSTNLGVGIYDPIGSQIQILGIGSPDPFLGSMDMSGPRAILPFTPWVEHSPVVELIGTVSHSHV